jgi:integrase-like protein
MSPSMSSGMLAKARRRVQRTSREAGLGETQSYYGKTRQEAREKLMQGQRDREMGVARLDERQTVEQFLLGWLDAYEATVEYDTWRRACQHIELHAIPIIGRVKLARLTPQHIQALYADRYMQQDAASVMGNLLMGS